jgi:enoyl-CoA hydratase/carnithine racemase
MTGKPLYAPFSEYSTKYETIRLEREEGVLRVTMHTDGGALHWGLLPHRELPAAFRDIGADTENKVVILTGSGDVFTGPFPEPNWRPADNPRDWNTIFWEGRQLLNNYLAIEVPVIAAVNGPAYRHSELALLADIVLASEHAVFGDFGHFSSGLASGDGINVAYMAIVGINRARYLMLTGESLSATRAEEWGLVNEVLAPDALLPRANELALQVLRQPPLVARYTRIMMTHDLQSRMHELLGYGLALEGLACLDPLEPPPAPAD